MMGLVLVSYFLSAIIFYFYGNYYHVGFITWFIRWMAYPLLAIVIELPNMLVIRSVMGTRRTVVFVVLTVSMATVTGLIYGGVAG